MDMCTGQDGLACAVRSVYPKNPFFLHLRRRVDLTGRSSSGFGIVSSLSRQQKEHGILMQTSSEF